MSKIHYFQRYTQRENVVTNNTMLLFSRLYHHSPLKFNKFLEALIGFELEVGVNFSQQEKNHSSIPDGIISQESFKIAIETKLHNAFGTAQLINHLASFGDEKKSVLIALSNVPMDTLQERDVKIKVGNFNEENGKNVQLVLTTFQSIVSTFREELSDYDLELNDIIDDFEEFCNSTGLLPKDYPRMLIVPCGNSIKDNFQFKMYYEPASRNHSRATHLGIYNNKQVKGIAHIANIVEANYDDTTDTLHIISENQPTTEDQKARIVGIIKASLQTLGWSIKNGHKFYCLDDLESTSFVKTSRGGIMGKRFEDLENKTGLTKDSCTKDFAAALKNTTWV